jgi:hypothetical protein
VVLSEHVQNDVLEPRGGRNLLGQSKLRNGKAQLGFPTRPISRSAAHPRHIVTVSYVLYLVRVRPWSFGARGSRLAWRRFETSIFEIFRHVLSMRCREPKPAQRDDDLIGTPEECTSPERPATPVHMAIRNPTTLGGPQTLAVSDELPWARSSIRVIADSKPGLVCMVLTTCQHRIPHATRCDAYNEALCDSSSTKK